jgi:hypothetical protein
MELDMRYLSIFLLLLTGYIPAQAETACNSIYQAQLNILTLDCVLANILSSNWRIKSLSKVLPYGTSSKKRFDHSRRASSPDEA